MVRVAIFSNILGYFFLSWLVLPQHPALQRIFRFYGIEGSLAFSISYSHHYYCSVFTYSQAFAAISSSYILPPLIPKLKVKLRQFNLKVPRICCVYFKRAKQFSNDVHKNYPFFLRIFRPRLEFNPISVHNSELKMLSHFTTKSRFTPIIIIWF